MQSKALRLRVMGEFPENILEWRPEDDERLDGIEDPFIDGLIEGALRERERKELGLSQDDLDLEDIAGITLFLQQFSWPHVDSEASVLDKLRSDDPGSYLYFMEGARAYHEGRHAQARDFLSSIPKLSGFISYLIGESEFSLGNMAAALVQYEQVLAQDSHNVPALISENFVYHHLEQPREQIAVLDRVLAVNARIHGAWRSKGFAYAEIGMNDKARDDFRKALKLEPNDAGAHFALSKSLAALHEKTESYAL